MAQDDKRINDEINGLRKKGLVLPRNPSRAFESLGEAREASESMHRAAGNDLRNMEVRLGRPINQDNYNDPQVQAMLKENKAKETAFSQKRSISHRMQKQASGIGPSSPMGGDAYNAIPRFYDPLEYWDLAGIPWNVADQGHRHKLHKWMRLYYATHYLVPVLIDIFSRFPLVGMEIKVKDPALKGVYESIFLDNLDYEEFLVSLGREYFLCGEAFPLASFDEDLGVFDHEELINPEDVVIDNFPLLNSQQLKIVPPDYLKRIAQTKQPAREWYMLKENYEDIIPYLLKGEHIPISPVLLRQVANKLNDWDDHGTPMLLRGLRTLLHEEKLLASQDAIAERLYSPFILAKLGIMDMGANMPPWIPTPDELEAVRDDLDIALASDFRVMVHHFGLDLTSVFGREQMPRLGDDFDRIERRLMEVFGVNPSLLSAGSNSQPYASSALQAEFMNQILRTFQKTLKNHFKERASVVAEAQGHYAYEQKGKTRVPVYEQIVIFNEDGEKEIKRVNKLLIPELDFAAFDMRDEQTERQFVQSLRAMGLPIPDETLMIGMETDYKEMVDIYNKELKIKTIAQQEAKMQAYKALTVKGLPVPLDLKAECESVLLNGPGAGGGMPGGMAGENPPPPGGGGQQGSPQNPAQTVMPLPPTDMMAPGKRGPGGALGPGPGTNAPGGGPPPIGGMQAGPPGSVPPVSNERRPGLKYNTSVDGQYRMASKKGSAFDEFAADHPELNVAFWDYLNAHTSNVTDLTKDELEDLHDDYPNHAYRFEANIRDEVLALATKLEEEKESGIIEEPWELPEFKEKDNHTLVKNAGSDKIEGYDGDEYILKVSKTKTPVKIETEKKYSVIDPLAPPLKDEAESTVKDIDEQFVYSEGTGEVSSEPKPVRRAKRKTGYRTTDKRTRNKHSDS